MHLCVFNERLKAYHHLSCKRERETLMCDEVLFCHKREKRGREIEKWREVVKRPHITIENKAHQKILSLHVGHSP